MMIKSLRMHYRTIVPNFNGKILNEVMEELGFKRTGKPIKELDDVHFLWF